MNGNGLDHHQLLAGRRGALIVLEGLDRSGKSTQVKLLMEHFERQRMPAIVKRFPDRNEPTTGPAIDDFLRNAKSVDEKREVIHLLFVANRWVKAAVIREELAQGRHLILDRYTHSGIAYSLAKGMDRRWVCQPEVGLPRPDLVLFLDADSARVSARGDFGAEVMERSDFQQRVYKQMNSLFDDTFWRRIDANQPIDQVHQSVVAEVSELLDKWAEIEREEGTVPALKEFTAADFGI